MDGPNPCRQKRLRLSRLGADLEAGEAHEEALEREAADLAVVEAVAGEDSTIVRSMTGVLLVEEAGAEGSASVEDLAAAQPGSTTEGHQEEEEVLIRRTSWALPVVAGETESEAQEGHRRCSRVEVGGMADQEEDPEVVGRLDNRAMADLSKCRGKVGVTTREEEAEAAGVTTGDTSTAPSLLTIVATPSMARILAFLSKNLPAPVT